MHQSKTVLPGAMSSIERLVFSIAQSQVDNHKGKSLEILAAKIQCLVELQTITFYDLSLDQ